MNIASRGWPQGHSTQGFPTTTNAAIPGFQNWPRPRLLSDGTLAGDILKDAVFYIDATEHQAAGANPKTIRNLGWGGDVLNARSGSTTVADTNDPLFLPYYGTPYVYAPGSTGNNISCPDESSLNVVGDLEIVCCVTPDSWASGTQQVLVRKYASPNGYLLSIQSAGTLNLTWGDGVAGRSANSSVTTGFAANTQKWLKATLQVDNGAGGHDVIFYTSDDGVAWSKLGATVNGGGRSRQASQPLPR